MIPTDSECQGEQENASTGQSLENRLGGQGLGADYPSDTEDISI